MGHSAHFEDNDPLLHVMKKKSETHGLETPSHISMAADGLREGSIVSLLVTLLLNSLGFPSRENFLALFIFALALTVWKTGKSAWVGWAKLERLHKVMVQEKYEIEHNREQERLELIALYKAKGFEGKLLDDVIDVLMADNDRLLKVMLEEEMGLSLASYQHPLKQAIGACLGSSISLGLGALSYFIFGLKGVVASSLFSLLLGVSLTSVFEKNDWISAAVWNLSLGFLSVGISYFLSQLFSLGSL